MRLKDDKMFRFLAVLTISSTVGLQAWRTLFNNFAVEIAGLDGNHIGMIQSFREIPGFLALLAIFILLIIKEHKLSAFSIILLGLGVGITGLFPSYTGEPHQSWLVCPIFPSNRGPPAVEATPRGSSRNPCRTKGH